MLQLLFEYLHQPTQKLKVHQLERRSSYLVVVASTCANSCQLAQGWPLSSERSKDDLISSIMPMYEIKLATIQVYHYGVVYGMGTKTGGQQ